MEIKRKERGQSMVEFAIALPILLIILAGVLDLGRLYYAYVAVTDAAGEGAAYAAMRPDEYDEIFERAQDATGGMVVLDEEGSVVVDYETLGSGDPITVTVSYSHTLVTPLINVIVPDGRLILRAVATEAILTGEFGG